MVTALYRRFLPVDGTVLDLMSSWVSHLPAERHFAAVIGNGMNADELAANTRLTQLFVHDLHVDPNLPLAGDGSTMCWSTRTGTPTA